MRIVIHDNWPAWAYLLCLLAGLAVGLALRS